MNLITTSAAILLAFASSLNGYESMYGKTPVGKIQVILLPERVAIEARASASYFSSDNGLFKKLFRYISTNKISMTTPVEADINPGKMRFFLCKKDRSKKIKSSAEIKIRRLDPILVLAIGIRGGYTEDRFRTNESKLKSWIGKNATYEAVGEPYAVYWNGPLVPGFLKRSEIHQPVRKKD
ncbi:MAG: hypothetical protein HOI70_13035 [Opitutae bacterium]|jgi:hypothetical protein|nr:hypothetical protein [Opitutae bacterium]